MNILEKFIGFLFGRDDLVTPASIPDEPIVQEPLFEPVAIKPNPKRAMSAEYFFPPHFSYAELTHSNYATRHGINNIPSPAIKQNLLTLAKTLEKVRDVLGHPMTITSGYRNPELNRGIGGAIKSAHLQGYAADFICWGFGSPSQIVRAAKKAGIKYDQIITEGKWVHISIDPRMRGSTLIAKFNSNGKASYSNFS